MPNLEINQQQKEVILSVSGNWSLAEYSACKKLSSQAQVPAGSPERICLNASEIEKLDTSGSKLLIELVKKIQKNDSTQIILQDFTEEQRSLFELVHDRIEKFESSAKDRSDKKNGILIYLSKLGYNISSYFNEMFGFIGQVTIAILDLIRRPAIFRPKEVVTQIEEACIKSIPVVILVTFLIGVVVAYLMALQLEKYGGNIFVVNGVALAMCREMSPVIVALVMAGRSGSAYTAQIGAMKLNEEVDAITTLGLSVQQVLVLPRLFALVVSMPLLVFIGDLIGILGGMIVADSFLGISHATFIERLKTALPPRHFVTGMIKAPVFAAVIAMIGCRRGLATEMNARSVGMSTTATVVESIVLVIILNAVFAVIFAQIGV